MSIDLEILVDPEDYDSQLYDVLHTVLDRTVELASKADNLDTDSGDDDETEDVVSLVRAQANFTPAESSEFRLTSTLLNVLMGVCISRRSGLYASHQDLQTEEQS